MTAPEIASEETSSDFHEPTAFNIAAAFPPTEQLVRKINMNRRREKIAKLVNMKPLWYGAAALIGYAAVGYAFRR